MPMLSHVIMLDQCTRHISLCDILHLQSLFEFISTGTDLSDLELTFLHFSSAFRVSICLHEC